MPISLVTSYEQVKKGIRRFNEDLGRGRQLVPRLRYVRAWYYDPDQDLVGPSKFIGYSGMTAKQYVEEATLHGSGRDTEPALRRWFRSLDEGSPEAALVRSRVEALLARHGKALNKAVRFCAPIGWKAGGKDLPPRPPGRQAAEGRRTIHAHITRGETHYIAECERLAVVTQGSTLDETLRNLKEAVELHLEGESLQDFGLAPDPVVVVTMELQPWAA